MIILHPDRQWLSRQAGFTLVEVLVSLVIASFILAVLFSATRAVGKRWSANAAFNQQYIQRNAALEFLRREIAQLAPLRYQRQKRVGQRNQSRVQAVFSGTENELMFATTIPRHRAVGGLFLVSFSLQTDPELDGHVADNPGRQLLFRYQRVDPVGAELMRLDEDAEQKVLLRGIDEISFEYFGTAEIDQPGETDKYDWYPQWQHRTDFPSLVKINISFVNPHQQGGIEQVLPIQATGRAGRVALDIRDRGEADQNSGLRRGNAGSENLAGAAAGD